MKCKTKSFGELEFDQQEIITLVQPPFGFDGYKQYVLLYDDEAESPFAWMQSLDDADLCFTLAQAKCFAPWYRPEIPEDAIQKLGSEALATWVICVIPDNVDKATANLKSPLIINSHTQKGMQVILSQDYPVRHPLTQGEG